MKFQILAAAFAASAAAAPSLRMRQTNGTSSIGDNQPFGLVAIHSGSAIQYSSFGAAQNSILVDVPSQNATCTSGSADFATFSLTNGALYLWTPAETTQELYTDRSGMGQGILQYSTTPGGYLPGKNSETTGWKIDESGDLTFDGDGLIACPNSIDGAWSVWTSAGVANPGGNSDCVGINARAVASNSADTCTYTYTKA